MTIGAILTAVGLLIGLIAKAAGNVAVTGGGGGAAGGGGTSGGGGDTPNPKPPNGDDNIVKKGLKKLADVLKRLASKALDALPGFIGALVSTLFKTAASVVTYFVEHLWAFGAAVGFVIYQVFINNTGIGRQVEHKRK